MNYARRHTYYVNRTIKWLERHGNTATKVETNYAMAVGGRTIFVKRDFWGADIACRSSSPECISFLQVKTSVEQVAKGVAQLTEDSNWPSYVGRFVVWWDKGSGLDGGPNIAQVRDVGPNLCRDYLSKKPCRTYIRDTEGVKRHSGSC